MSAPLQLVDAAVALGGRPILRRIDLTVHRGEVLAVLGANGSGKSTLVRAALGLTPLTRGAVRIFGTELAAFGDWHRVGYVPQRPPGSGVPATVREVVTSGRLARRRLLTPLGRTDRRAVAAALEAVRLSDRSSDSVVTLSGGQQQRVLIARALAGEPDLLVLDEPTAGVDLQSQELFADTLRRLIADGATVLMVAHELGPLEPLIDRVAVVDDGRIVYQGPPRMTHGLHAFHDHPAPGQAVDHTPIHGSPLDPGRDDDR